MCYASQAITYSENSGRQRLKTRLIALLICIFFATVFLLSSAFIFAHASHTHDQDGPGGTCATCACVVAAENLIKTLGTALIAATFYLGGGYTILSMPKPIAFDLGFLTLVLLKIRLNN
ncbi:hypothetical protein LQZ18_00800 [Lachnospiraceae bacterium ZAX-1]